MALIFRRKVLFAKAESTYGTDPTPVGGDAILTSNLEIVPYQGNTTTRDIDRNYLGGDNVINTGPNVQISFDVEIAGSGAAGTAPQFNALLLACAMAETVNAGVSVVYAPVSTSFGSVTLYVEMDGEQYQIKGCRGTFTMDFSAGTIPKFSFTFTGLYTKVQAATLTADFTGFQVPLPVTDTNTPTLTIGGYAAKTENFTVDLGNTVNYRNVVNGESVVMVDRATTGSCSVEGELIATNDFYAAVESHNSISSQALALTHGTSAGNIVSLASSTMQLTSLTHSDSDGIRMYNMDLAFPPSGSGNDELTITFT